MKDINLFPFERNKYFYGKLLTVRDFETEQRYFNNKRRILNRTVVGAGVITGMSVSAGDDSTLMIESGIALDYLGRELIIRDSMIRKLQMIEGYDTLIDKATGYLCIAYKENETEPVNAVGGDNGQNQQYNKIEEGCRIYLDAETPPYRTILEAAGKRNVNILYSSDDLTLILYAPDAAVSSGEFDVHILMVKNAKAKAVSFRLSGDGSFVENSGGKLLFEHSQSQDSRRCIEDLSFKVRTQVVSDVAAKLFSDGAELQIEIGDHVYKNYITVQTSIYICRGSDELDEYQRKNENLKPVTLAPELPIYLAKLELVNSSGGVFINSLTNLPFGQLISQGKKESGGSGRSAMNITASAESLEYWKKPEVHTSYDSDKNSLHFAFGIPSPEVYDYQTSHGVVEIPLTGGPRVNGRYYSEEIPHGLGIGNVNVTLAVEFDDDGERCQLIGNNEVFSSKTLKSAPPWVEAAAVLYPERGTMVIGIWLHDTVEGRSIKVHYYAERAERDTDRIIEKQNVSVAIIPEITRVTKLEQVKLKAVVTGSDDKSVTWIVKEKNGGEIDKNGVYKAPEAKGTYEVIARSVADPDIQASAFIIVE